MGEQSPPPEICVHLLNSGCLCNPGFTQSHWEKGNQSRWKQWLWMNFAMVQHRFHQRGLQWNWKENRFCKTIMNQSGFWYVLSDQTWPTASLTASALVKRSDRVLQLTSRHCYWISWKKNWVFRVIHLLYTQITSCVHRTISQSWISLELHGKLYF